MFDFDTPREAKRFRVNHPNGYIEINVGTFFGTSPQKKVNKLLRLARKYCTEEQRRELLCNIVEAVSYTHLDVYKRQRRSHLRSRP